MIVTMYGTLLSTCGGTSTPRMDISDWIAVGEPEHERGPERADRMPRPEDDRGERDEPAARAHAHLEAAGCRQAQVGAGDPGEGAGVGASSDSGS